MMGRPMGGGVVGAAMAAVVNIPKDCEGAVAINIEGRVEMVLLLSEASPSIADDNDEP